MFVYSIKGTTLKFVGIICLAAILVLSLILILPKDTQTSPISNELSENATPAADISDNGETLEVVKEEKINYNKIRTNEERISFLKQFGWEVEAEPTEEATVKIPKTFDKVMTSYNALQQKQGLDLTKYAGKEVTRYSYKVTNYPDYSGDVTANIIVCKNRVVGGDICSSDIDGFIRGFEFPGNNAPVADENNDQDTEEADTDQESENTSEEQTVESESN